MSCIEWRGATNGRYGVRRFFGRQCLAHRVAWAMEHGEWPSLNVCHKCDNPLCINPAHLFLGTQRDNIYDMIAKGRYRGGGPAGERNGRAVLSRDKAAQLRADRALGTSYPKLAHKYAISTSQAYRIAKGESWT